MLQEILLSSGLSHRICVEHKVETGKTYKQSPIERNLVILSYLKKYDGEWKNKNQIATYSKGHGLQRARLEKVLEDLIEKGLIIIQEAENPQAKFEYKITEQGKGVLNKLLIIVSDPTMKFVAGIKLEKMDELE